MCPVTERFTCRDGRLVDVEWIVFSVLGVFALERLSLGVWVKC